MYSTLFKILRGYWSDYGGWKEFIRSPFLHLSIFMTFLYAINLIDLDWRAFVIGSLPTILGFSLAAYAITFSLMGSALHRALSTKIDKRSGLPLIKVINSTFFHVLIFQLLALLYSIFSKGNLVANILGSNWFISRNVVPVAKAIYKTSDVLGFFLSSYSTILLLSVGVAMFRLGRLNGLPILPSSVPAAQGSTNDNSSAQAGGPGVTGSLRFRFVAWLARSLGLYDKS
jgi:hypothetical protein